MRSAPPGASNRARLLIVTGVLVVAVAATGCGGDGGSDAAAGTGSSASTRPLPSSPSADSGSGSAGTGTCPAVVEPSVISGLGWDPTEQPVEGRGGCVWEGSEGSVVVFASGQSFDEACARLESAAPPGTFETQVAGVTDDPACGYLRTDGLGNSELVVDAEGEIVSVTVTSLVAAEPTAVRQALVSLASTVREL